MNPECSVCSAAAVLAASAPGELRPGQECTSALCELRLSAALAPHDSCLRDLRILPGKAGVHEKSGAAARHISEWQCCQEEQFRPDRSGGPIDDGSPDQEGCGIAHFVH